MPPKDVKSAKKLYAKMKKEQKKADNTLETEEPKDASSAEVGASSNEANSKAHSNDEPVAATEEPSKQEIEEVLNERPKEEGEKAEAPGKEAKEKDAKEKDAKEKDAKEKDAKEKEALEKLAIKKEAEEKEAEEKEALEKEASEKEAIKKEAREKEALEKEAKKKRAEEKEALEREAKEKEALVKAAQEREALEREDVEKKAQEKEIKEKEAKEKEAKERKALAKAAQEKASDDEALAKEISEKTVPALDGDSSLVSHSPETSEQSELVASLKQENADLKDYIKQLESKLTRLESEIAASRHTELAMSPSPPLHSTDDISHHRIRSTSFVEADLYSEAENMSARNEQMERWKGYQIDIRSWATRKSFGPVITI